MPRTNKITARLLPENRKEYDEFLNLDKEMGLNVSDTLRSVKDIYKRLLIENQNHLETLSQLEEIIIQNRCKEVIDSELRLSLSRNYIYARSLFYRRGKEIKDIRVVVGITEDYGDKIDELINDPYFRTLAKKRLLETMNKEIENNITNLKLVYTDEKI